VNAVARTNTANDNTNRRMLEPPEAGPVETGQELWPPDYTSDSAAPSDGPIPRLPVQWILCQTPTEPRRRTQ
jgi:hypothetical protein